MQDAFLQELGKIVSAEDLGKIKSTAVDTMFMMFSRFGEDTGPEMTSSKVGLIGYWPENLNFPTNDDGEPLGLLAQINFAELPRMKDWPGRGILAFYIDIMHWQNGCNVEHPTKGSDVKVAYFRNVNAPCVSRERQEIMYEEHLLDDIYLPFPIQDQYRITGQLVTQYNLYDNLEFSRTFGKRMPEHFDEDTLYAIQGLQHIFHPYRNFFGGYPAFTQEDPRFSAPMMHQYDEMLLQLDTTVDAEAKIDIMWGDCGVANFFAPSDAKKKLNFDEVWFNWDCY